MNLLAIKPDTLVKRDEALNENFSTINEKVEDTARTADAGLEAAFDALQKVSTVEVDLTAHVSDKNNPHNVTAEQLGLANAYVYRGSIANYSDLPTSPATGDVYNIVNADDEHSICAGDNVAWNGTAWDNLSGVFDTSALKALISENADAIARNTEALTEQGSSITELTTQTEANSTALEELEKAVDDIETQVGSAVLYTEQVLTDEQKSQVKTNLGITGPDLSGLVLKVGDRGSLAGYQDTPEQTGRTGAYTVTKDSPDIFDFIGDWILGPLSIPSDDTTSWIKVARLTNVTSRTQVSMGTEWSFVGGEAPTLETDGVLIFFKCGTKGYINYLSPTA